MEVIGARILQTPVLEKCLSIEVAIKTVLVERVK